MSGRYVPLFWRLFVPNAVVLCVATVVLRIWPANGRLAALAAGLTVLLAANLFLMRKTFAPLTRLTQLMREVDPLRPGQRIAIPGPRSEVTELGETFDEMLERLETERRESARRELSAQETERRHIAAELHDEIGQTLTALSLHLTRLAERTDDPAGLLEARTTVLGLVDSTRSLARRLRPEALDQLGLVPALTNLAERMSADGTLRVRRRLSPVLPPLDPDTELVIYRVAQESLTNVVRHAHAGTAELRLACEDGCVVLSVGDDGDGVPESAGRSGGLRLMRERALMIGADLSVGRGPAGGTTVTLRVAPSDGAR